MIKVELVDIMGNDLTVVNAARVSYSKTKDSLDISDEKLIHTKNVKEIISLLKERLNNHVVDEKKYTQFTEMIKSRDRYRNVHIKNYMPELAREVYK